jgi:hypothetical protein
MMWSGGLSINNAAELQRASFSIGMADGRRGATVLGAEATAVAALLMGALSCVWPGVAKERYP